MSDRVDELSLRYRDGVISAEELAELQQLLRDDDEACEQFVELLYHTRLIRRQLMPLRVEDDDVLLADDEVEMESETPIEPAAPPAARRRIGLVLAMAAAVSIAATVAIVYSPAKQSKPAASSSDSAVAMLADASSDAKWVIRGDAPKVGSDLRAGTLELAAGTAQVMFRSGAVVDLSGPCVFAMTGTNRGRLISGEMEAYVPTPAHGFSVEAEHVTVTDLGTRFYLANRGGGPTSVGVIEGKVRLESAGASRVLTAGYSVSSDAKGMSDEVSLAAGEPRWWTEYLEANVMGPAARYIYDRCDDGGVAVVYGPHGVEMGDVKATPDRFGRPDAALAFDGRSGINLRTAWPAGNYTVSVWVAIDHATVEHSQYVVGVQDSSNNPGRFLRFTPDCRPQFQQVNGKDLIQGVKGPPVLIGHWVHVAVTFETTAEDAGRLTMYVNGEAVDSTDIRGDSFDTAKLRNMTIGCRPDRHFANRLMGRVDDLMLLRRTLSADQIRELFAAGRSTSAPR